MDRAWILSLNRAHWLHEGRWALVCQIGVVVKQGTPRTERSQEQPRPGREALCGREKGTPAYYVLR
jgi:hypothetical protein